MNFLLLAAFLLSTPLHQGHPGQTGLVKPALPFYRITRAGSPDTSYLFGTLHLLEGSYVDTMPRLMAALRQADVVVGELVLDSSTAGDALQSLMDGPPLDSLLTKTQYSMVSKAVATYSPAPMMLLNNAEPVIVYSMILEGMYEKAHPENHKSGIPMDLFFEEEAKDSGKSVIGLESADDQEQVLDSIPIDEQVDELIDLVQHPKDAMKQMDSMLDEYRAGKITEILDDPSFGSFSPEEMASLLYDRNKKWLQTLPAILDHNRAFIAVGAGHLVDKNGLVEGLRKLGYKVDPLNPF
jgi:uncharacterized protein YbaP (TraB family)